MKVFVVCDEHGEIRTVFVPNPAFADHLGMEAPPGGRVHVLDVAMSREEVLEPRSREARQQVHDKLRAIIARRPARAGRAEVQ